MKAHIVCSDFSRCIKHFKKLCGLLYESLSRRRKKHRAGTVVVWLISNKVWVNRAAIRYQHFFPEITKQKPGGKFKDCSKLQFPWPEMF